MRHTYDQMRKLTVSISFADDNYVPSLQAADMVAYLARLEGKRKWFGGRHDYKGLIDHLVDEREPGKEMHWGVIFTDEHKLRSLKTNEDILAEKAGVVK